MKKGLILESSSAYAIIAETANDHVHNQMQIYSKKNLSSAFFQFLANSNKDFSFIAVGIGPGSYTGVRISLTIAKSLAYALKIPIVSFSSLSSFSPNSYGRFISALDAKIGGVYASFGNHNPNDIYFEGPKLYSIEQIQKLLPTAPKIISPDANSLKLKINSPSNTEWIIGKPNAKALAKTCFNEFLNKNFASIHDLKPIYLRDA